MHLIRLDKGSEHALGGLIKHFKKTWLSAAASCAGNIWGKGRKTAAYSVAAGHCYYKFLVTRSPGAPKSPRFTGEIVWWTKLCFHQLFGRNIIVT